MKRFFRKNAIRLLIAALLLAPAAVWFQSRGYDNAAMAGIPVYDNIEERSILADEDIQSLLEPSYFEYEAGHRQNGAGDAGGFEAKIRSIDYSAVSEEGAERVTDLPGDFGEALALTDQNGWAEYKFAVPEDGFYQIGMDYYALPGKRSGVVRSVQIDGEYPFFQAKKLTLQRMWRESGEPWQDNQGNEFNPAREEIFGWQYKALRDSEAKIAEPLRFYLTEGEHVLRIAAVREPAAMGDIRIFSPASPPDYAQVKRQYEELGYEETKGTRIKIQAEEASLRSDPTLKRVEDREPSTEPFNQKAIALNAFGGDSWRSGEQWAEWEFEVPEDGLYNIGMRFGQHYLNGIPTERKITIDGKLPFREMNGTLFPYKAGWQIKRLGAGEEDYLYYLAKGKHTIRMEVQVGSLGGLLDTVRVTSNKLSLLYREIIRVTGTSPDPNIDWELEGSVPNLVPRLHILARNIHDVVQSLYELGVEQGSSDISTLLEVRDTILGMADETRTIPGRLASINDLQSQLGTWINGLSGQRLLLDYILIQSPDQAWPKPVAPWHAKLKSSAMDLAYSFVKDYGGVGNVYEDEEALDVWVARGRDWVQIIKQMIDEDFTTETGIKVNVNLIPAGQMQALLLANTSGLTPDVALGVEGETPIDFAVRNALVNLNEFGDYDEVADRFRPGALIPYKYNGGDYALPENQNFNMLFYRKDVMSELGITDEEIPQTWEEAMALIPLLQQNGMDFYYPHAPNNPGVAVNEFAPFLFQHGGELYDEEGMSYSLDSPEALQAMEMWTSLFTNYKIEKQADFYNRFRSGEMPIGVADYSMFILLSTAAPELTGWWEMRPLPGIAQPDGRINRSTGGLGQTGIIFKDSEMKDEAWQFLKWWTSADAQERFGTELEALLGVEARWNTANVEALNRLPWERDDLDAILEQWEWFREREVVVGGYFTTRHIANMWNEIVLNGKLVREAVEEGVREINKELRKKREEFGLAAAGDGDGRSDQ
ncbi:extracellular solute-binding protein [Paenibacillus arenilitoris]|uniref:Extracellular solute-binding protein n=1 Tax=Paenibacillus arenilitoris TaxID=2772299 RepID=A0A927CIP7_9BACL|nr:extracellular solute-binding protein [Paenibacillus arenilitoris]MBD2867807.1 extracellular solute-binding protein [Paenibacillus arenilitoris]